MEGFSFQPRHGEKINLRRISKIDIPAIIRDLDTELLSSFLEEIAFCELTEDMITEKDSDVVKVFQVAQLIIEYLIDMQDTLSANLTGLSKKCASRKGEIDNLAKQLAKQDAEVANLKDELFYNKLSRRVNMRSKASVVDEVPMSGVLASRIDPKLFPSQERRPTTAIASLEEKAESFTQDNDTIRIHVISSTHGYYLDMNVEDSLTVQNLKSKLVSRLQREGNYSVEFELLSLYHKDHELKDSSQSLKYYEVGNDAALVLMPKPVEDNKASDDETSESKLEGLTSLAVKAHEELIQATRSLQLQVSMQESSKEAFAKSFDEIWGTIREEINHRVQDAVMELSHQKEIDHKHDNDQKLTAGEATTSPLSKLGELVETDNDFHESSYGNVATDESDESGDKVDVPLKVDTTAEVFDREMSPFNPPSEIEVTSDMAEDSPAKKETKEAVEDCITWSMRYSPASSTNSTIDATDERTPTPQKGYLDRKVPPVEEVASSISPFRWSGAAATSSEMKRREVQQFRFSGYESSGDSVQGIANIIEFPDDYDATISMPDTTLNILSARSTTVDSDDLQSIAIPHSEFVSNGNAGEKVKEDGKAGGKKKKRVGFLKKGKKMVIKWNKSRRKSEIIEI